MNDRVFSEFEGGGVMPNTVFPREPDQLDNSDKLRLQSLTGQEIDSRAPVDPAFWNGGVEVDPRIAERAARAEAQKQSQIRRQERARYRETPKQY